MPIDPGGAALAGRIRLRRVLRLTAGTTLALWMSQAFAWELSFVAPVLTLVILALPVSRPPASLFVKIVAALVGSVYGSFVFLPTLVNQRIAGLILVALALFHSFYLTARGKPAAIGTFFTIGITVTVALGSVSVDVLLAVAEGLAVGAMVGAGVAWLMHIVLPDPLPSLSREGSPAKPPALDFPARRALRSLIVVLPVTIWFLLSPASASNVGVMIKVAAMGQEASGAAAGYAAKSLLVSTLAGGLAAIVGWELLSVWPSLTIYALFAATASLWFAGRIFEGAGMAPDGGTWMYALLTMLVVLAPAVLDTQIGSAASASFYDRLLMFTGASLYGVTAVYVFDSFWPLPRPARAQQALP